MTGPAFVVTRLGWTPRRRFAAATAAALMWALAQAGIDGNIVNGAGWSNFARFWTATTSPELGADFLRLTWDAAIVTLSYAVLGSLLSLVVGAVGGLALSEVMVGRGFLWRSTRALLVIPRAVHEVLWALLLLQVFGFDPLVAVLAIALPYGAVTAKVFGEAIDDADRRPFDLLRASGASRPRALLYGLMPLIKGDLVSYSFYRFECAIRSAAVLGVIGAGGLGFQLNLSFETLRYAEIWTLIVALLLLSGLAEAWATAVRRNRTELVSQLTLAAVLALVPLSIRWSGTDLSALWSARTRRLAGELFGRLFPSRLGLGGWGELIGASLDTVAMSLLATTLAATVGLLLAAASRRRGRLDIGRRIVRLVLLLSRAVPAPIWAFLFVLILFPGFWPGVAGLAVYNIGVLGRLFAEALEEADLRPAEILAATGANAPQRLLYGLVPTAAPRLLSLTLYRWEVVVRETIVVGVVGAGGLGQLINEHLAARDFAAITGAIGAMILIAVVIDIVSNATRRIIR